MDTEQERLQGEKALRWIRNGGYGFGVLCVVSGIAAYIYGGYGGGEKNIATFLAPLLLWWLGIPFICFVWLMHTSVWRRMENLFLKHILRMPMR